MWNRSKKMLAALKEDIHEHIERETQENLNRGMRADEARYAAIRKFGNVTRVSGRYAGGLDHALVRSAGSRYSLWRAPSDPEQSIRAGGHRHARGRHRREHRDFQRCACRSF